MKTIVVLGLALVSIVSLAQAQDLGVLLGDQRIVQRGIRCILDQGACDMIGRQIKLLLPEALNNQCQHCNPRQKRNARKLMQFMQSNYPHEWNEIVRRYSRRV